MFHLDDDAYEKLSSYLDSLKLKFIKMEGGDEIITDIETRIAEIFKEKIEGIREVVILEDVNEMIGIMGEPHAFTDEDETEVNTPPVEEIAPQKRLYRDTDNRVLGGVCSGFAAYLNLDAWVVRLIMVLLVLFGGVSFLLYFIFWLAMPEAVTTTDKLMMRGKRIDVKSIEQSVKQEWAETKNGIKNVGRNAQSSSFINGIGKFLRISIGVFLIFFSTITLAGFLWAIVSPNATIHLNHIHLSMREAAGMVFDTFPEMLMAYVAAWLCIIVPCVLFVYLGIRLILQFTHRLRYVMLGGFLLWLVGLVLGIYSGITLAHKYQMEGNLKETRTLDLPDSSLIKISVIPIESISTDNSSDFLLENVNFDIVKSTTDTLPVLEIERESQGREKQEAYNRAKKINFVYTIEGNNIRLASAFLLNRSDKFRGQTVNVKLILPVGYKVFLDKETDAVINDIKNIQRIWDNDMEEHTFTMTSEGLSCDDCPKDIWHTIDEEEKIDSLEAAIDSIEANIKD